MDIDTMVENHFKKNRDIFGFEGIAKLIEEVMDSMQGMEGAAKLLQEAGGTPTSESFDWNAIPEIPISELGWSDTRTRDAGGPQGGQRKLLMDYLKLIGGKSGLKSDIPVKIKELNEFMANPDIEGKDAREKISKILSYLVFYKTLTRVITNFNASSAGFSFESFLAVLTGGTQIETGGETIADYKDHKGRPVSLKLYSESSVEVGGSWQDLGDDLANDKNNNQMTYLVVLKSLDGEGLDQEGTLSFYRFTLTLDNIANFIDKSSKDSREMIALPLTPEGQFIDLSAKEPEAAEPEAAELEEAAQRVRAGGEAYQKNFNEIMNSEATNFISSIIEKFPELAPLKDELLSIIQGVQLGSRNFPKLTDKALDVAVKYINAKISEIASDPEKAKILNAQVPPPTGTGSRWRVHKYLKTGLKQAMTDTNQKLKKDPEAARKTGAESLLKNIRVDKKSIVRSITYYNSLVGKPELQKKAIFSS